jgi:hypothetical protein
MSVLEMVRTKVKELTDPNGPAGDLLNSAKTAMAHGLDGASKFVDEKTGGKYSSTIHTGVGKAKVFLGEQPKDGAAEGEAAGPAPGDAATDASAPKPPEADQPPKV